MGGAQAIAALAYGTETVARVDVIVGPGNLYVQEAKRQLSGAVGIDGFAGPSDLLVVMGPDADPRSGGVGPAGPGRARQREPGGRVSYSGAALDAVAQELEQLDAQAPEVQPAVCALVEVPDTRAGIELANAFAPEHLQLIGAEPEALAPLVRTAGCLFVGAGSATAFGDYVAGSNHILPTARRRAVSSPGSRHAISAAGWRRCGSTPPARASSRARARRSHARRALSGMPARWRPARRTPGRGCRRGRCVTWGTLLVAGALG